ncbi:MAG: hypothetical protein BGP01_05460 [Paludibacter sp. 47-17]|nr:MAG: hypothetical protein BGP01_05460 [Paludibacter sp. 47-17]
MMLLFRCLLNSFDFLFGMYIKIPIYIVIRQRGMNITPDNQPAMFLYVFGCLLPCFGFYLKNALKNEACLYFKLFHILLIYKMIKPKISNNKAMETNITIIRNANRINARTIRKPATTAKQLPVP